MSRSLAIPALLVVCGLSVFAWQMVRWRHASKALDSAVWTLQQVRADAADLDRLRAARESALFGEPPAEDFLSRVSDALGSLGLPASLATDITREADRAAQRDAGLRRRDMRIELRPIAIPDLGRFLAAWNAENSAWRVRQLSIRKINDRRTSPLEYHVSLTCSAEYTATGATP